MSARGPLITGTVLSAGGGLGVVVDGQPDHRPGRAAAPEPEPAARITRSWPPRRPGTAPSCSPSSRSIYALCLLASGWRQHRRLRRRGRWVMARYRLRRFRRLRGRNGRLVGSAVAAGVVLAVIAGHAHTPSGGEASVSGAQMAAARAGGTLDCSQLEALWESAGGSPRAAFTGRRDRHGRIQRPAVRLPPQHQRDDGPRLLADQLHPTARCPRSTRTATPARPC